MSFTFTFYAADHYPGLRKINMTRGAVGILSVIVVPPSIIAELLASEETS